MEHASRTAQSFSPEELRRLEALDSSKFGYLNLTHPENQHDYRLVAKSLKLYEQKWTELHPCDSQAEGLSEGKDNRLLCEVALKLGHLNLLVHNFVKALSAYQFCYDHRQDCWKDSAFLYGIGLVYFHFNVHKFAKELFEKLLYCHPNFIRSSDVHVRIGLCAKILKSWEVAIKHLKMANADTSPSIFSKPEGLRKGKRSSVNLLLLVLFHIAHCLELKGELEKAQVEYRALLSLGEAISPMLRSCLHRQLGWLIFRDDSGAEKQNRVQVAISELQQSLHLDALSGKSHYYLGRCLSFINRAQDAFISYRNSIDKNEANPETWCSIGVLYQQQRQPFDALQAYACAIELNSSLVPAWIDLGLLYEQHGQLGDSLECYKQAYKHKGGIDLALLERIEFLETELKIHSELNEQKEKSLPQVESISSLPIPAQLMERQRAMHKDRIELYLRSSLKITVNEASDEKRPVYLTPQQLQLMHVLQQNVANLNPQQMLNLRHLQETYTLMVQQGKGAGYSCRPEETVVQRRSSTSSEPASGAELASTTDLSLHTSPLNELPQVTQEDLQAFLGISDHEDLIACLTEHDGKQRTREDVNLNFEIPPPLNLRAPLNVLVTTSAEDILTAWKQRSKGRCKANYDECVAPIDEQPHAVVKLPKDKLLLPTPVIVVDSKKDASLPELQHFCYDHPVALVRNLSSSLKLDLALFSTVSLVDSAPDHQVQVYTHIHHPSDKNFTKSGQLTWQFDNAQSFTTVSKYAAYQARSLRRALKEDQEKNKAINKPNAKLAASSKSNEWIPLKEVKYGTIVDLPDCQLWKEQLKELSRLPVFCRLYASSNLLSHLGHAVSGMNVVQMQLKVPGCRIAGHQEGNSFACVNINVGPGECSWFAVPDQYWTDIKALCEKNEVDFFHGSWWPCLEELWENNIPIYKFTQMPGDVVWIGPGTIYWVIAAGWCNNISWNVGPLTSVQYLKAVERYEVNRYHCFKSVVPMIHLSWQLARNVRFSDESLYGLIRKTLLLSMVHCQTLLEYICQRLGKELKYRPYELGESAHYCCLCDIEVFNILLLFQRGDKYLVYCLNCALKQDMCLKNFTALNQYHIKDLTSIYDSFVLLPKKRGLIC